LEELVTEVPELRGRDDLDRGRVRGVVGGEFGKPGQEHRFFGGREAGCSERVDHVAAAREHGVVKGRGEAAVLCVQAQELRVSRQQAVGQDEGWEGDGGWR